MNMHPHVKSALRARLLRVAELYDDEETREQYQLWDNGLCYAVRYCPDCNIRSFTSEIADLRVRLGIADGMYFLGEPGTSWPARIAFARLLAAYLEVA